jgi:hypothetical protein
MVFQLLPDEVLLYMADICGATIVRSLAVTCHHLRVLLQNKQRHVLIANPVRILSGQFVWLNDYIRRWMGVDDNSVHGRLNSLKLVYAVQSTQYNTQSAFLQTLCLVVDAFLDVTLVIQNSPLSMPAFVQSMSTLSEGGRLALDLSYHIGITVGNLRPLWKYLFRLSELRFKLRNTDITDAVLIDLAQTIDSLVAENQPIQWVALKLGLAHNMITDQHRADFERRE